MPSIGRSLSGGGHRAALFGLGILLYLADARRIRDVVAVASVSGGSLTNGYCAQSVAFGAVENGDHFRESLRPFAHRLVQKGTLLPPTALTLGYLAVAVVVVGATFFGVWFLPRHWTVRFGLFLLGVVVCGLVLGLRGLIASRAFAASLFSPDANRPHSKP